MGLVDRWDWLEYQSNGFIGGATLGFIGNRNRLGGSLAILTIGGTNQKQTRVSNPFGNYLFPDLPLSAVVFLELKPKRAQQRQGLLVIELDNLPTLQPTLTAPEQQDFKITITK